MWDVKKLYSFNIDDELERIPSTVPELAGTEEQVRSLKGLIHPKIYWMDMEIRQKDEGCISVGDLKKNLFIIESSYVAKGLYDCQKATLIAATIGAEISLDSNVNYNRGQFWEGIIADRFGSYAMETLIEKFHKYLTGSYISKGLYPTLRFSPGYGDWQLQDQKKILDLLDTEPDITVNSFSILEPTKSITALVGWSRTPQAPVYPMGAKSKGLCDGKTNCQACKTWACKS
ncbi:hypothetical protein HNQ80_003037 [Anaerosolibacter carboniphilus]|uniref:Vitamin B12 dependent methionine synthase, activation domain n=1 Tax=Anaerosolibacter carboniphilus TaxID=1417629 RepID=A0A841L182_9FIRM|nr:hypothetical protein [Anaerosolibacter carboniphilus]MBB6216932.1 hypothetical protein [Anaerosolibacter carboniphilus]